MDNMYDPAAGGGYPAGRPDPDPDPVPARSRGRKWFRWGAGVTLAGFLAGGGITLALVSGGGTAVASPASSARAAQLNTALTDAADSSDVPAARVRWALGRLRHLGGVEGNVTYRNKTGFHTVSFERGTIQSVSGSDVVLKSPDGTTWTWHIVGNTVIRKNGSKTTTSALSAGETAFAGGPLVSGARDARLIIVRPTGPAGSGSSGSQSAQTSLVEEKQTGDACRGAPGPGAPRHAASPHTAQ